ncbi:tyrosine-type recombinase/integrase [Sphingobium yanoikuyae]|uniref:tyrosine-type recombinase/integrase n=1 Tax=Sphingobium yanoikuyae TaxID=13690 RepID=UPI00242000F4|nr:integrase arm-type DNA-binding domain-containing protein [Sphingobium yanoikuyae]
MTLTFAMARNAAATGKNYKLADEKGLFLYVTKAGAKSWRFKYRFGEKEKLLTFGLFPEVGLAEARDRQSQARAMLRHGLDPAVELERRRLMALAAADATFQAKTEEWLDDKRPLWSAANAFRVRSRLEKDIFPVFGHLPVSQLSSELVLLALRRIEQRGAIETAKRVRGYVLGVLKRARAEGLVSTELVVSVEIIRDALRPSPPGIKQPALTRVPQLIEFQRRVDLSTGSAQTRLASRLLALSAVRVGVLRTARWEEIEGIDWSDPDRPCPAALWRIPAARMKLAVEDKANPIFGHDVPLSRQAVATLHAIRALTGQFALLFPSSRTWREPMSDAAISTLYKRLWGGVYKGRMVPHGWRSAFSTVMNERAAELERDGDRMIIDLVLAHVPKGTSASEWAYNRARYFKPRREMLQSWADLIMDGLQHPNAIIGLDTSVAGPERSASNVLQFRR